MEDNPKRTVNGGIGVLQEHALHANLKRWYAQPGDRLEERVGRYVIDIVRDDLLIEIQTGNFSAIRRKLLALTKEHPVRLVYPIPAERWIVRAEPGGKIELSRRRSPIRGRLEHLFKELVRLTDLPALPNFSLEVLLIREEEVRVNDGNGSWRRKGWSIHNRRLIEVLTRTLLQGTEDYRRFLPHGLPEQFTARDLALVSSHPLYISQKLVYCLRRMGLVRLEGRRGRSYLYTEVR
jgi:hypothetical protein